MTNNEISRDVLSAAHDAIRSDSTVRASLAARFIAWLRAGKFDDLLAVGVPAPAGSALAVHQARLTSATEREAVARTLRQAVHEAHADGALLSPRIPVHPNNIAAAEELIDRITLQLHSPRPVGARGMARLRRVLSDGCGPLYRYGRGDLTGRLGAALAEL
ncbi:hypothetical protein [Mycobacterium sp.]|uniref:hypothetical protein n=1 Tax=Mycobacterium sp. TaxID=1785 RepID=UPI002B66C125|nr:hypothetical protein [Mycobacterium sp.]HKP41858.1 hypothetical protein [Mycobacterium sp.]